MFLEMQQGSCWIVYLTFTQQALIIKGDATACMTEGSLARGKLPKNAELSLYNDF